MTGSNTGIGKATAEVLLRKNAKASVWLVKQSSPPKNASFRQVYVAARSEDKARAAIAELKEATSKTDSDVKFLKLDLGDLTTIKSTVEEFLQQESQLHLLFNNGQCPASFEQSYELKASSSSWRDGAYMFFARYVRHLLSVR